MLRFYKEKKFLISLLVIMLDGIIVYFIPSFMNKLNYFFPMLTISLIPFLSKSKKDYLYIFIVGIIYDLLYSNIILYHAIIFFCLGIINQKINKYFNSGILFFILLAILNIIFYDTISFLLVLLSNYQSVTINDLIYKIEHSILLNIMSVFVYYFLFKKKSINA